jgi:diadenosine tetraphosphate (Ap4A) HIT family hydrolase
MSVTRDGNADCPFCDLSTNQIAAESDLVVTLRDGFPVSPGHTRVVPKRHFASPFEATAEEMADIWQAIRVAAERLRAEYQPAGFNIGVNDGAAAGQTVMHLHWHLIPRYQGDQPDPRGGIRRIFPALADYWSPQR